MTKKNFEKDRLDGWKEISGYLGRDVRTCQRWEKESGLPVYRINDTSDKSKVYSFKEDLDTWLKSKGPANNHTKSLLAKIVPRGIAAVLIIGIFSVIAAFFLSDKGQALIRRIFNSANPVSMKVRGTSLAFFDVKDRFLWSVGIDNPVGLEDYYYDQERTWLKPSSLIAYRRLRCDFSDIDHDGKNEVLCSLHHSDPAKRCITLFNNSGKEIWSHIVKNNQLYNEGKIVNNYQVKALIFNDIDGDGTEEILALWTHVKRFPSLFLIYDKKGKEIFRYAHTGILQFIKVAEISRNHKYIFLGGTNNLLNGDAVLSVLDCSHLKSGVAPPYKIPADLSPIDKLKKYIPIDPDPADQSLYVRFKKNILCRINSVIWLDVLDVSAGENGIIVTVNYDKAKLSPIHYLFDQDFKLKEVLAGADLKRDYMNLLKSGKMTVSLDSFLENCKKDILIWNGQGWTPVPLQQRKKMTAAYHKSETGGTG